MWVFEAIIFIYFTAACAAQDSKDELPVPVVQVLSQWSEIFPAEKVELRCEIHNSFVWSVTWYKDEKEVQNTDVHLFLSEDKSMLTVTSQTQSAKYSCKGVHKINSMTTKSSNSVQVTVHANKLKPALSHNLTSQKTFVGESVTFKCSIDVSFKWEYLWFLNERQIHKSYQDVFTIQSLEHSNNGKYSCQARRGTEQVGTDKSSAVTLEVVDVPVPSVKLLSPWSDVFVSERVLLGCESDSTDWSFTWFRNDEELTMGPTLNINEHGAKLQISSTSASPQVLFTCKAHHKTKTVNSGQSQPLNIRIHDTPKPTVMKNPVYNPMYVGENVKFTCEVFISSGWTYKWYKDDKEMSVTGSTISIPLSSSDGGQYFCKAFRGERTTTESSEKITQAVIDVPVPSVKLLSPWSDVFVHETVKLGCEAGSTDWSFSWFRNGGPLSEDGILKMNEQGTELLISSASKGHAGAYSCKAHHKTRTVSSGQSQPLSLSVYENTPKPTVTKDPTDNPMYVGETVTFACRVHVASGWKFKWFKEGREIGFNDSTISVPLGSSDGGQYYCKATRGERTTTESSEKITQTVLEIPVPSMKNMTEWLDVFPTETLQLGCGMMNNSSDWTYEWLKDNQKILLDGNSMFFDSDRANLTISSASASHKGQYQCKGRLKGRHVTSGLSTGLKLTVYDSKPRPALIQDPEYSLMFNGEPVSFKCQINVSNGWEFMWYSDKKQLNFNQNSYSVSSLDTANSGSYTCKARRGKTHSFITDFSQAKKLEIKKDKPKPVMSHLPNVEKVYTGEMVMFTCEVKISSDWEYLWYKNGQLANVSDGYSFTSATSSDAGNYKCKARRRKTMFLTEESAQSNIHVSEIPMPSVKALTEWLDVFPSETVELSCGMETSPSSDWSYKWQKDGQAIQSDKSTSLNKDGSTLTIYSSVSHNGEYSCMGKLKDRSVQSNFSLGLGLTVYGAKPTIVLKQDPEYSVMYTSESVSFSCGVNLSSGWEYQWYIDNSLVASGQNYTIASLQTSHSGEYKCQAKRGPGKTVFPTDYSQTVRIDVQERPAVSIILLTGWSEVFSTDSLVLKCEVEDNEDEWEYKWFKGAEEIPPPFSEKHTVTPQNDPDQSQYVCQGIRNERPSYTRRSEPFKTNNLLLKRRVLLSISGCLLFGICAVFLGCIVLRFLRKPVVDLEKPEEASLFLTMAELKKRGDAPSPLVEYVTDEDIQDLPKASATEANKNGTVSSETTPLPIASKEDVAAPCEGNNATENGGMVSFKQ